MPKYIDWEALGIGRCNPDVFLSKAYARGWNSCIDIIQDAPAADVAPVVHAHWTIKDIYTYELSYGTTAYEPVYECSACKRLTESYLRLDEPTMPEDADFPKYCPTCGAKMDESEEKDNV